MKKTISHSRSMSDLYPWVGKLIDNCQNGDLESFYSTLEDYERYKKASLEVNDLESLLNMRYNGKWSCIHYACYSKQSHIIKELLELAADCNLITSDSWTPLQISCYQGSIECVKILLSHPALNINKMTSERGTGLHLASQMGYTEIAKLLLEHNIDFTLEDPSGKTALELAGNIEIAELIPQFIGEKMLRRYSCDELSKPLSFSGEVWYTTGSAATEKLVYIFLDIEEGNFKHFKSRSDYVNEFPPKYSIPFTSIIEVKVSSVVYEDKHFFVITASDVRLKYYTAFSDMSNEWTIKVIEAINFFRVLDHEKKEKITLNTPEPPEIIKADVHLHSLEIVEEIGSGAYSKVFKVIKKDSGEVYALKSLNLAKLRQKKLLKYAISECKILKAIKHPFIIPMFWDFQSETHLFMVLEYCFLGDLSFLLAAVHHLTVAQAKFYIAEIVLAVEYLHSLDIIYRDLKPHNMLIDDLGHVKLADFGLAKENINQNDQTFSFCGTPNYLAPEVLTRKGASKSLDVYCIGVNLYEMIVGETPFYTGEIQELYRRIEFSSIRFPEGTDENAKDFIVKTMDKNPSERPSILEVKQHAFFSDVDWDKIMAKSVNPPFSAQYLKNVKKTKLAN